MRVNNSLRSKIFKSMLCLITVIIMTVSFALPQTVRYSKAAPPEAEKLDDEPVEANFYGDIAPSSDIANYKNGKIGTRTVKVGYFMIDGFQMYDENYGYSGYCYDYLQKIRTYTGWDYEYIGDDEDVAFSDLYRMTVEGEIDLIGGITWTQERADKLIFCNVPIAMEYTTIFVKNGDTTFLARAEIIGRYDFDNYATKTFRAFIYDNPMYGFVVIAAGLVIFFLVIINHIGKRNRRKIEDLNQKLSTALDGEKKASEAKKRFFSNMSHDMRTPLNGILGLTRSVIRNGINSVNNLDYLYKIEDSANYLELLINDSLAMSNLGRVEIELNPQMCDPGQVFDSLKNVALTFARERDIRIILRRKEIVNLPTMIDYSRLEQAILNVISNAVKFSRKSGTIEIDLTSSMIDDGKVEYTLSVQDHGIGMSSDFQKTMFDAYTQEDRGEMTDQAERIQRPYQS